MDPAAVAVGSEADSFEDVFRRESLGMVRLAFLMVGSVPLAEEIVQDAFARLLERWDGVEHAAPYLRSCVMNGCKNAHRRRAVERKHSARPATPAAGVLGADHLQDALAALPVKRRAAIVLRYYHDLSEAEIAELLHVRPGTVKSPGVQRAGATPGGDRTMNIEDLLPSQLERVAGEVDASGLSPASIRRRVQERARRRRMRRAAASGGVVVLAVTLLGALWALPGRDDRSRAVLTGPAPASNSSVPPAAPTLVAPTVLPAGLEFIEGGSVTLSSPGGTITVSSAGSIEPVRLTWWPLDLRGGCEGLVASGPSPATDPRASRALAIRAYLEGTVNQIGWCERDGALSVILYGLELPRQQLADLAMTVARSPGEAGELTLVPPAGFTALRDPRSGLRSVLTYGRAGAARPTVRVQVETATPYALERARAERGGELATLGGRRALIAPAGILVLYDDRTLASVSGTAVSELDVRLAAESLAPADPSLAPPVESEGRGGRCTRLGLCP